MEAIITGPGFYRTGSGAKVEVLGVRADVAVGTDEHGDPDNWGLNGGWDRYPPGDFPHYDIVGPWIDPPDVGEGYEALEGEDVVLQEGDEYFCAGPEGMRKWCGFSVDSLIGRTIKEAAGWWLNGLHPVFYRREKPTPVFQLPDPGEDYRLLGDEETIHRGDEYQTCTDSWQEAGGTVGMLVGIARVNGFSSHYRPVHYRRKKTNWQPTTETITLRKETRGSESRWVEVKA